MGLNSMGLLIHGSFSINSLEIFVETCDNLKKHFLLSHLLSCKNTVYKTHKTHVDGLFMLSVRLGLQ